MFTYELYVIFVLLYLSKVNKFTLLFYYVYLYLIRNYLIICNVNYLTFDKEMLLFFQNDKTLII